MLATPAPARSALLNRSSRSTAFGLQGGRGLATERVITFCTRACLHPPSKASFQLGRTPVGRALRAKERAHMTLLGIRLVRGGLLAVLALGLLIALAFHSRTTVSTVSSSQQPAPTGAERAGVCPDLIVLPPEVNAAANARARANATPGLDQAVSRNQEFTDRLYQQPLPPGRYRAVPVPDADPNDDVVGCQISNPPVLLGPPPSFSDPISPTPRVDPTLGQPSPVSPTTTSASRPPVTSASLSTPTTSGK